METITSRQNPLMTHIRKLAGVRRLSPPDGAVPVRQPQAAAGGRPVGGGGADRGVGGAVAGAAAGKGPAGAGAAGGHGLHQPRQDPPGGAVHLPRAVLPVPETLPGRRYVVLDGVQDPGNVGTVLRTLDAFDADGLLLTGGCADPFGPKTVRASMGAVFRRRCGA